MAKGMRRDAPQIEGMVPRGAKAERLSSAIPAAAACRMEGCFACCFGVRWERRTMSPPMSQTFAILLPMIFPEASPPLPFRAAWIERKSSGAEVPKPTMATPARAGERRSILARARLPCMVASPPMTRMRSPMRSCREGMSMGGLCCVGGVESTTDGRKILGGLLVRLAGVLACLFCLCLLVLFRGTRSHNRRALYDDGCKTSRA